jgi:molybdenum cofactor cytidylyltransferase
VSAGLILAAGESRRMGSPKALLRYRDDTFLDRLAGLFAARCSPVIVVLGAEAERIRSSVHPAATYVVNQGWARGQTTSMQCGLRAVPSAADGVLLTLVDHPAVLPATIDVLLAEPRAALLRVPRYHGRRGHPIWFSRDLIPEFLALPETGSARDVVASHGAQTEFLDVDDPGILANIDDSEAYRSLIGGSA